MNCKSFVINQLPITKVQITTNKHWCWAISRSLWQGTRTSCSEYECAPGYTTDVWTRQWRTTEPRVCWRSYDGNPKSHLCRSAFRSLFMSDISTCPSLNVCTERGAEIWVCISFGPAIFMRHQSALSREATVSVLGGKRRKRGFRDVWTHTSWCWWGGWVSSLAAASTRGLMVRLPVYEIHVT